MCTKEIIRSLLFGIGHCLFHNRKSKIIYYHDFSCETIYTEMATPMELFKRHLKIIKDNNYEIVTEITRPEGQIAIMLDDGFRGIWDNREFFIENKLYPTIFIAESLVGKQGYLGENEIKEMHKLGFNFQSHTISHEGLNTMDIDKSFVELKDSKDYIERLLVSNVDAICAPKGQFSNKVCEQSYRLGYNVFYASTPGYYNERITDFSFVQPRNLAQSLTPFQFECAINGGYKMFQKIYLKRRYIKY